MDQETVEKAGEYSGKILEVVKDATVNVALLATLDAAVKLIQASNKEIDTRQAIERIEAVLAAMKSEIGG